MQGEHAADPLYGGPPLPPFEVVSLLTRSASSEAEGASFLQQVGMEVGSLAGIHGDRTGIRNIP